MSEERSRVYLTQAQETLLITLYSKVYGVPHSVFNDPKSQAMLSKIDYDFEKLKIPHGTQIMVCLRAKKLDQYVRAFLAEHPDGLVLHLGAGLDSRFLRVDNGAANWIDLDLPDVIDLRRKFFEETDRYRMIASSAADLTWLEQIKTNQKHVMVVAEGLLMYLNEDEVKSLLLALQERFPGCRLVFDCYSSLTVRNVNNHPSIKETGAQIQWGLDDPKELETWSEGIKLEEEWFYNQSEDISQLDFGSRLLFWLTGLFVMTKRAHRILAYTLQGG